MNPFRLPFRRPAFDIEPFWQAEFLDCGAGRRPGRARQGVRIDRRVARARREEVEVKVANGVLTIKGEKHEDKEEKNKDFHMRERRFGSFERALRIPESVDTDKIEASFKKGVLTVTLPKTAEAQKPVKKIEVKGG